MSVLYEPFGPVAGWTWGNSTIAARVYDTDGKPTNLDSAGAYTYGYDDAFRITSITDLADSTKSWTYGYDLLDRLNAATKTSQTIGYTYDANGNRLTQTGTQTATYTVSTTNNRITSITGTPTRSYSYDAAGNTSGDGTRTFTYQDNGRMELSDERRRDHELRAERARAAGEEVQRSLTRLFMYDEARAPARRVRRHRRAGSGDRVDGRHPRRDAPPERRRREPLLRPYGSSEHATPRQPPGRQRGALAVG